MAHALPHARAQERAVAMHGRPGQERLAQPARPIAGCRNGSALKLFPQWNEALRASIHVGRLHRAAAA